MLLLKRHHITCAYRLFNNYIRRQNH